MTTSNNQNAVNNTTLTSTEDTTMSNAQNNTTPSEIDLTVGFSLNNTAGKTMRKSIDFSAYYTNELPEDTNESLAEARAAAIERHGLVVTDRAEKAFSIISLIHMLESVGGKDTWLGEKIFNLGVHNTQWWGRIVKEEAITYGRQYQDALVQVVGSEEHESVYLFKKAIKLLKNHRVEINEDGTVHLIALKKVKNKRDEETLLKTFANSGVKLSRQRNGIKVLVKKGTIITPIQGQDFVFSRNTAAVFGIDVINSYLESVLDSVKIHNEYTRTHGKDLYAHEVTSYTKQEYTFRKEDALVMLLLLKENNIDIKDLYTNVKQGKEKLLVLSRAEKTKKVKSLKRIIAPAFAFPEKYSHTGVTSLNDAKQGYVVPMVTIPRLVEFTKDSEGFDIVITREDVNKTINRFDKLNNSKSLWTRWMKVFVITDCTTDVEINKALVGGNILVPDSILLSDGVCRVVTDMDNGGIKSSTTSFKGLDENLRKGDTCVISSAGFKGGMLAALGLAYGDVNGVKTLFAINENTKNADTIVNNIKQAVLDSVTTMVINGKEVSGVFVTVEVKITNAYTIDSLMKAKVDQKDLTAADEKERVRQNIEDLLEEMDTESKVSNGLRAYVANKKAGSADLFSVQEWMEEGLEDKTLIRKPAITKIIAQEIQSIAHWYGKPTAKAFLLSLLANQEEHGFSADKLYAIQYLGAVERDIKKEIHVQEVIDVLNRSNFKLTQDSPVYTKETMKELLELFENDDFGWVNLVYQDGTKVSLPVGKVFVNDIEDQMENDKKYVVAKGLINDALENIKGMVKEDGTLFPESESHMVLKVLIQKTLLGKGFGYQYTKGYYGVALPMLGNYGVSTAGITNRNRMIKSNSTWEVMTLSKAPQYFKGMTASYNVVDLDFGYKLNMVFECAVFVNVEIVLMHQNDFDGDMYRITLGDVLPFVETIYNEFNGKFFKDFYEGELESNILGLKKSQICYLNEYHEAVSNAIKAKDHIGSYTANSYFYEAMLPNLIGETFVGIRDEEITVSVNDAYCITSIMKMLIQIEAMDNVKQKGSSTFITEMLTHYKLRNLRGFNGMSDEKAIKNHLNKLVVELMKLVESKGMDLTKELVIKYVEIMYHTAKSFNPKETKALNVFNARIVNEKALNNVTSYLAGEEYDNSFDFENTFDEIVNGSDTESMYYEIIIQTVESLTGSDTTIRI